MLEGLVATLLNRFLGMYVKNFSANDLQVGIWSGDVKLKNLELRREALDQLHLPLNVVEGHIGHLTLQIPLSNLRGKPVRVEIEDVFLLAAPKEEAEYDEGEEKRRAHAVKMEKLENAELLKERNAEGMSKEEQQKNQSFTESLVTAIVDNLQVRIKNIHIRYEDSIAAPGHPFSLGVTLSELSAVSTDENWSPTMIQSSSPVTHKLATLSSLAVYWNTDTKLFGSGKGSETREIDHERLVEMFRDGIESTANHQYMLRPVSGRAGIEIDKTGKIDRPKVKARLLFNELGFVLDDDQYRDALMMVDLFHYFMRHQEYKKSQPKESRKENPRAWIRFAGQAVLDRIHERNRKWTWEYMKERKLDRDKYIDLFKKKKKEEQLSADEKSEMQDLEESLSYEDLRFWRSLARNQLRKENVGVKKPEPKQTWGQWIWGGGKKQDQHEEAQQTQMTEEDRQKLMEVIDYDEKKALAEDIDAPREVVKFQLESALRKGSFTLKRDPHGKQIEVLSLIFDNFQAKALQRPDSMLADISLGGLRLYDGTTPDSLFPQIVKVKGAIAVPKDQGSSEDDSEADAITSETQEDLEDKLFHLVFEKNPLDESADSAISLQLRSFEIIYNPKFVVEIARFFKPPERHMESIGALMETAGATVEGIRQQTRAGLEFALQEHKTINAQFDIRAPLIIVPESVAEESTLCMILDAGHASLNSELIDKKTLQDIRSKQKAQYSEADYHHLENLMYDKFALKLDSTQVLIGPGIEATKRQLEVRDESKSYHIIDRINMDFLLELSILPKDSELTKTRVSGNLPVLHASISDRKYKNLMRLIDIAIPKFGDDDAASQGSVQARGKDPPQSKSTSTAENALARPRSKSIQASSMAEDLIMDEDDDSKVQKVEPNGKVTEINLHQRNFEFKFTVDKLQGSLYKSDPSDTKPDQLLVELVAEHFHLDFYQRPYDMVAEVVLRSLAIEDYVEENPTPEFKNIISSQDSHDAEAKDLVTVRFVRVQKESPEFQSTYEGIAMNLDVAISTINLVVTRKTLLTLLDFVLITFTNPQQGNVQDGGPRAIAAESGGVEAQAPASQSDKIRVKADLNSIALVLNNDGIRLATLSLHTAHVGVFLSGGTMRVDARLGDLSLLDDVNQGASEASSLRRLVAIEGNELADFKYETFNADRSGYPGYDSKVYLRSGSLKVNFVEEPFRKIIGFLVKFGQMQAIFNAARQAAANQANQIQEKAGKMHFDVLIKTPILVFPRVMVEDRPRDLITAYLGEIYAKNQFAAVKASKSEATANKIGAGIRNIRLTSAFHFANGRSEELEMIDKVDLDFKVQYIEHETGLQRPDLEIAGGISPVNLRISQSQTKFLLELSKSIPSAFAADPEQTKAQALDELPKQTTASAEQASDDRSNDEKQPSSVRSQGPELGSNAETWTKLDLTFKAPTIGLELINSIPDSPVGDVADASLSIFAINDTSVKLKMLTDGAMESELLVHSFTIKDSRAKGANKFRKVMSLINDDVKQQLMASFTISGGEDKHLIAMVTLDSPKIIFAMDYVFELVNFASAAFAQDKPTEIEEALDDSEEESETETALSVTSTPARSTFEEPESNKGMAISFRVNIEDAQVILIANPSISHSEAIVLGTKQVLFSQQNASTLQVTKVGMFLCRMDKFDSSRLRILDDLSVTLSMENRSQGKSASLTSIHIDIEPLVLRLSLRDILLATQIFNKASAMTGSEPEDAEDDEPLKIKEAKGTAPSVKKTPTTKKARSTAATTQSQSRKAQAQRQQAISMRREEMSAEIQGIRVILIGDLHELPLIDWSVKKFEVDVRDWSSALTGDTNINTYINVYNFSKSAWEPLIEPWQLGFHMAKEQHPDRLAIELFSHKNMELTITSATIALASKSAQFLSTEEDVLSKPRGSDAPYKIRNYTGFDLDVWAAAREEDQGSAAKLSDGEEVPWRFEDATTMRESLSPDGNAGIVGVRLQGSGFDSIQRIHVNREGETLYNLKPRQDRVQHRLLVEVKLGADNVKYITFRSPLIVENNTQIPIEIGVFSPEEGHILKIEKIPPGEGRPAPVGAAFKHSLLVRPDQGFGYAWSNERMFWKDLLKRSTRTIACHGEASNESPPFFFQMNANYNQNDPMTSVYPYMRIRLSAPIELQNLLPFDFKYRIYDKNTKKDWTNFLRKGGISPIHVVELSHLLLLSVEMQDTVFRPSEFAVINSTSRDDFKREVILPTKDENDLQLNLRLHYFNSPDSGGAFKISVYSPYLVLNKTGQPLEVQSKARYSSRSSAGVGIQTRTDGGSGKTMPYMFSYPNDDRKNRALMRIGESDWSKPQSFDAIGSSFEVLLPSRDKKSEMHAGVHVTEGEGKYNLTKVVTIAPRFIIKNRIERGKVGETIQVREPGSSTIHEIKPGALLPLRFLRQAPEKQICLCFPGVNNVWTSPFSISSVGAVHVKIAKAGQRQDLIRAEVIMEDATLFIHLSVETKHWPFSMRNESETSFMFYQANPNVTDDEEDRTSGWKPIRYKLPKRSIMPYAWDFPAAGQKELIIVAYDGTGKQPISRERRIKLAEIGNLMPLKTSDGTTIDLNIVAEGPTQTLVFSKWKPQRSLYRQKTATSSQTSVSTAFEVKELDSDVTFKAELRLQGIGVSLINQQVRELLYFTLRGLELKYHDSKLYQTLRATVKWIQIDNQLYGGIFPILLYPSVVPKTGKEMEAHPIFHAQVTRVKDDSYGVLYIKYATLLLQQMTVEIDEDFIFALLDFTKVPGASWTEPVEGRLADDELDVPEPTREESGQDVYFETLHLQPVQLDLSFVRTERINAEDTMQSSNPIMFFVNVMTMSIGNVNDAPLRFNALLLENARISVPALITNIRNHYTQEALRQVHVILGSADFLGNPVGLFNNISSGVLDIFYEPYQGLVMTDRPQELGIGIAKGATSFVKKSVFGFSDSMAKFTGSMSKGLAAATLDKEYQDQRRMSKARNRPKHALYGVTSGGNAFASSLASGIGGLARHPLEGAEQEGIGGFVKGVGKGFLGLATKPAIGAFDLASNLAEGVRNTTTVFDQEGLDRVRLTRFVALDAIVRPYSQREALGQFWLKTLDDGKYFNEDYIAHQDLSGKDMMIMLTYSRIMLVRTKKLRTEWDIKLTDIQTISKERTGMSVTLKGGTNGPFIPVTDEDSRNWLYKQIAVAVNAFNDRYNAKG